MTGDRYWVTSCRDAAEKLSWRLRKLLEVFEAVEVLGRVGIERGRMCPSGSVSQEVARVGRRRSTAPWCRRRSMVPPEEPPHPRGAGILDRHPIGSIGPQYWASRVHALASTQVLLLTKLPKVGCLRP